MDVGMVTMVWLVYNFSALPLLVDVGNVFAFSDHISAMAVFTNPQEKKLEKKVLIFSTKVDRRIAAVFTTTYKTITTYHTSTAQNKNSKQE